MNKRHVYSARNLSTARDRVAAVRACGVGRDDLSIVARSDIELERVPDSLKQDSATDFVPATLTGALGGGSTGLLFGRGAMAFPPLGITVAGAALLGVAGTAVGGWAGSLIGAAIPNEVERRFEECIEAGDVLVVADVEEEQLDEVDACPRAAGASCFDYEQPSAPT